MTRTRCRSYPGRTATLLRCCAEPGSTSDTVQCSDMGPGSAAHRRSLAAPLVDTKFWAHGEQSALPLASRTRTLPRPPQARLANVTTTRSPLKDEPGWATHTPFPNFGKVEYFCRKGLTRWRVFCPTGSPPIGQSRTCVAGDRYGAKPTTVEA